MLHQLKVANNCEILLKWELQVICHKWIEEINKNHLKIATSLIDLHWHRAIMDYCLNNINLNIVTEFKTIMSLLEAYYEKRSQNSLT